MGLVIQDGVIHYRKQIPDRDLAQYLPEPYKGKWALQRSLGESTWNKTAEARRDEAAVEFNRVVAAARAAKNTGQHVQTRFGNDPRLDEAVVARAITQLAEQGGNLPEAMVAIMRRHFGEQVDEVKHEIVAQITKTPRVHLVVNAEAVIDAWLDERNANHDPPDEDAIKNKRRKIAHLFEWTQKSDLASITEHDFRLYRARHVREDRLNGTVRTRDYVIDIKSLSAVAKRAGLITVDHAKDLAVPPRTDNVAPPFDDIEARVILEAARHAPPAVRWPHWLAGLGTAHNKEILLANADEFYYLPDGTLVWDMRKRDLKTDARPRILSIHSSIIREGFGDYLATRKGKRLFDGSFNFNDNKLNDLIRDAFKAAGIDSTKRFYSWRKRNADRIGKLRHDDSLSFYMAGHAAPGIPAAYYRFHELPEDFPEIVKTIEALVDPTLSPTAEPT